MKNNYLKCIIVFAIYMTFSFLTDFMCNKINFGDYKIIVDIVATMISCGVPLLIFRKELISIKNDVKKVGLKNYILYIFKAAYIPGTITAILDIIIVIIMMAFIKKVEVNNTEIVEESIKLITFLGTLVGACIVAPIFEELLFRKYMLDKANEDNKNKFLLLSALLFSLIHYNGGILYIIGTFVFGCIIGQVYLKYKNIKAVIVIHAFVNLLTSQSLITEFFGISNNVILDTISILTFLIAIVLLIIDIKKMLDKRSLLID